MNSIFTRRSVRKFKNHPVEQEKIEQILRAGMQAPSAVNQQPWEFIVVTDRDQLLALKEVNPYGSFLADCGFALVVLGNMTSLRAQRMWEQDMGACVQNMLLMATDLGLGSTWIGVTPIPERMAAISKLYDLPDHVVPFCTIAFGYPADANANHFIDRYDAKRVHWNTYQK